MGLDIGVLVLMVAGLMAAIALYLSDLHHARLRAVHMQKMRNGAMYQELSDILRRCRRRYVEQVLIRRECVEFLMMLPPGRRVVFSLESRGYRPLSLERQETLCALIREDLPLLEDRARYILRREKQPLPNGERTVTYVFTMKTAYKDALNRAPYYMRG